MHQMETRDQIGIHNLHNFRPEDIDLQKNPDPEEEGNSPGGEELPEIAAHCATSFFRSSGR